METEKHESTKGRIFKNPILESLTRTSFFLTFTWYPLIIAGLIYFDWKINARTPGSSAIWFISGMLSWSLLEYFLHRYVFHFINDSAAGKRFHYMIHGVHHENPRDEERLFMPPAPGTIIISLFFLAFFIPFRMDVLAFLPGLVCGYLIYVYIHYIVHAKKPVKGLKVLWRHHALHHYKYPDKAFGVSSPLWDYVFGTMPPSEKDKL